MCASEHTGTADYRIQQALQKIFKVGQMTGGMNINRIKAEATLLPLSTAKGHANPTLGNEQLPQVDTPGPTFLGVKLDRRLTWKPHIKGHREQGHHKARPDEGTVWYFMGSELTNPETGLHGSSETKNGICIDCLGHCFQNQQIKAGQRAKHGPENAWCLEQ